ncbi:hypothetical protein ACM67B_05670 [Neisseria sp. CCUG17229]|uniref:hypothetical protein n=1 Tax=Neisseria sp. CCUG17229 TaxID=3392036 RepID=UPI003A102C8A
MKTLFIKTIAAVAAVSALSACAVSDSTTTHYTNDPNVTITTDKSWDGLKQPLQTALQEQIRGLNNQMVVNDIRKVEADRRTVNGREYVALNFHDANGRIFRTRVLASQITEAQIQQFKKVKGATFIGVIPVSNRQNTYMFQRISDMRI